MLNVSYEPFHLLLFFSSKSDFLACYYFCLTEGTLFLYFLSLNFEKK